MLTLKVLAACALAVAFSPTGTPSPREVQMGW